VVLPILLLLSAFVILINTDYGRSLIIRLIGNYSYGKLEYVEPDQETTAPKDGDQTKQVNPKTDITETKNVSNILLLGMETFNGAENTDTMIIASIDSENNIIKLTSLMRDLYVEIPGYRNAKLNSAYAKGGISKLYATIEQNFGITMDGYVLVDFNDFEQVIDYIGGIDITLTQKEANYLRTTNYISNPAYRNVVAGTQHMNGNQVLGYCRIRKVPTETEHDDFGRTQRQRIVLEKIFEKMKSKNIIQLGIIMNNILSNIDIKTDISKSEYNEYLQQAADLRKSKIKTLRIPADNSYTNESYSGRYVKDVLVPKSWEDTRKQIYDFIYGDQ
jgi:LCP family protein required for cell wall assembly